MNIYTQLSLAQGQKKGNKAKECFIDPTERTEKYATIPATKAEQL